MNFEFVKIPELQFDLKAINTENGRRYVLPNGEKYPSVTTVLSQLGKKELFEWRKRVGEEEANRVAAKAARRGTALHTVCEKYLLNEMSPMKLQTMMPSTKELFYKIKTHIDENVSQIHCLEQALYSERLKIAGRVDCIGVWNGKLSVIDFKSSTRQKDEADIPGYFLQCTAYALMYEELTGVPIDQIVVLIGTETGPGQVFVKDKMPYVPALEVCVRNYYHKKV